MPNDIQIYQFKVHLKNINPMIWRRFLIGATLGFGEYPTLRKNYSILLLLSNG